MENPELIDDKFVIIDKKGHGATANVFLVKDPKTQKIYASKVLKEMSELFDKEVEILNTLKPINMPYIINIISSGIGPIVRANKPTQKRQYLVLEYAKKGELFNYLYWAKEGLSEKFSKFIFSKIVKGIQACHNAGICHRDLKMENILLDDKYNPKICDFGFATFNTGKLNEPLGTLNYAAPEILLNNPYDGFKADIFSLGVVLLNLATCKNGFLEATKRDPYYRLIMTKHFNQYWNVISGKINGISEDLKKLYIKMVSYRPQERPSLEEILNSDWMKEIRELNNKQLQNLENEVREELLKRESLVNEELKKKLETSRDEDGSSIDISGNRGGVKEEKNYFDLSLKPKFAQTGLKMNNYIKINGNLNPAKFMNHLANKIADKIKNCDIEGNKNTLKFNIIFKQEKKEEEEEIPKELEKELAQLYLGDDNEEENDILIKKNCILQVKIFESVNGGHLLRFVKRSGELEDYYKNLKILYNLISEIV